MKLKFVMLFLVATIVSSSCVSMLVWIPEASVLNQRLDRLGFQHFVKKTDVVEKFAGGAHEAFDVLNEDRKSTSLTSETVRA